MGSAVSLLAGLAMTTVIHLVLLKEYADRLRPEQEPLFDLLAWATALTVVASAAFVGEVKQKRWRRPAQLALLVVLGAMTWHYWPT